MKRRLLKRCVLTVVIIFLLLSAFVFAYYLLQRYWAHRTPQFVPDYDMVQLSEDTDYETIFLQTGLGKSAVDKLIKKDKFKDVLKAQEKMFNPPEVECSELIGWFTREDVLREGRTPSFADLQKGDILVTLSTHSIGWRHGHAALYVGDGRVLQSEKLGTPSGTADTIYWRKYSNFAVLRIKNVTPQMQKQVVEYANQTLKGVPYNPLAGIVGPKVYDPNRPNYGLQCAHLIWCAWEHMGYDLDSDGGRLVTVTDLLESDQLEVVQIYGMDPRDFLNGKK